MKTKKNSMCINELSEKIKYGVRVANNIIKHVSAIEKAHRIETVIVRREINECKNEICSKQHYKKYEKNNKKEYRNNNKFCTQNKKYQNNVQKNNARIMQPRCRGKY
jgi:D-ribose pyranose/furanose isomerase RbsD